MLFTQLALPLLTGLIHIYMPLSETTIEVAVLVFLLIGPFIAGLLIAMKFGKLSLKKTQHRSKYVRFYFIVVCLTSVAIKFISLWLSDSLTAMWEPLSGHYSEKPFRVLFIILVAMLIGSLKQMIYTFIAMFVGNQLGKQSNTQ